MKTVEIVVEEKPWQPSVRIKDDDMVAVMVEFSEKTLQSRLKSAGGRWDPKEKLWFVPYGKIRGTNLKGRMLKEYTQKKKRT